MQIESFKKLARECKTPEEFYKKAQKIKDVPPSVSEEFYQVYSNNGKIDIFGACKLFFQEANSGKNK